MAVVSTDIIVHGSANMQETDVGTQGGAIDLTTKIVFTDVVTPDTLTVVSTAAGDTTQTLTITGRAIDGAILTETVNINGTTSVTTTNTFERILKVVMSAAATGTISVAETTSTTTLVTLEPGILQVRRPFYNVSADAAGGVTRIYYEKIFFYNSNTVSALTSATIEEIAGGVAANIDFALEASLDGIDSSTNRITAPTGYTFDSTLKNVANAQNHSPGTGQGVWLRLTLAPGTAATNSTYQLRESGQTV